MPMPFFLLVLPGSFVAVTRLQLAPEAPADPDLRLLAILHRVKTAGGTATVKTAPDGSLSSHGRQSLFRKPTRRNPRVGLGPRQK